MPEGVTFDKIVEVLKEFLRRGEQPRLQDIEHKLREEHKGALPQGFGDLVQDAMHYLTLRGIARLRLSEQQLFVTQWGRRNLDSVEWLEADSYVGAVSEAEGGTLDGIVATYLREAKRAHEERLDLSCAVTLGCASERTVMMIAEAAHQHLGDSQLTRRIQHPTPSVQGVFQHLNQALRKYAKDSNLAGEFPWDELDYFEAMFRTYRGHRNDAGHPTGKAPDRDALAAHLQTFKTYARIATGLLRHFGDLTTAAKAAT